MLKVAPTLIVDRIEPSVRFWTEQLGFTKVTEVPGDDGLVFAMLTNGNVEVHFQTRESAVKDMPYFTESKNPSSSFLYIDVEDVRTLHEKLKGAEVIVP